jgi:hypothetical protein
LAEAPAVTTVQWADGRHGTNRRRLVAMAILCYVSATIEHHCMQGSHNSDYYREEAAKYRKLAEATLDAVKKQELLEMAAACEEVADTIDDRRASG